MNRLTQSLPCYRPSLGETSPASIVDLYWKYCQLTGINPAGLRILEIGSGRTNATAYELSGRAGSCISHDPYAPFDHRKDREIFAQIAERYPAIKREEVIRVAALKEIPDSSVDLVLSHSVLEHVRHLDRLLIDLRPIMKPNGCMIHIVDYRDHFFKYPYHFLQFSKSVWYRFLDPGDLTRSRIGDHLRSFSAHGYHVDVLGREEDVPALRKMERYIHNDFRDHPLNDLATTWAVLCARKC